VSFCKIEVLSGQFTGVTSWILIECCSLVGGGGGGGAGWYATGDPGDCGLPGDPKEWIFSVTEDYRDL